MSTISKRKIIDERLEQKLAENTENKVRLSEQEKEQNIIEWTTFFRRNLDVFNNDFLEIPTHLFQNNMILTMQDNDVIDDICSRGSSKSFTTGIVAIDFALLYSNCNILITSFTLNQSNSIIDEKIDRELSNPRSGISPVLRQLRTDGWMEIKNDKNTGGKFIEFGNGSKIFAVNCGDSARGKRAQIVITDECVLIKKKDYQEIIEPTLTQRQFTGKPSNYKEEPKQIFLSSAKTKTNWMWRHLRNCVNEHYKNKRIKYGFFSVDIFTAVASGIQTKNQYIQRKKTVDDMSFEQEYLNMFLGNNESSLFKLEDFEKSQKLTNSFAPRTIDEILYNDENEYKFDTNEDWIRIVSVDIAVASGNENDNTVFTFLCVNKTTGEIRYEGFEVINGLNSVSQVVLMKRYFYEYKATYFIMDSNGVGLPCLDMLTMETTDTDLGEIYPAWGVIQDKDLQIVSDKVLKDRLNRTISNDAIEVIIPFVGTTELNSQMHLSFRKNLKDGRIKMLIDDAEAMAKKEEKDPSFILKTPEEKARIMNPFLQTRLMVNEAISLEMRLMENGNIKLQEANRLDVKDRYISASMGNLLADFIFNKYNKQSYEDDIDESDFYEIYNY